MLGQVLPCYILTCLNWFNSVGLEDKILFVLQVRQERVHNIVIPALDTELNWLNKVCEAGITRYHSNFTIVNEW